MLCYTILSKDGAPLKEAPTRDAQLPSELCLSIMFVSSIMCSVCISIIVIISSIRIIIVNMYYCMICVISYYRDA